jgi:hypothetical protein
VVRRLLCTTAVVIDVVDVVVSFVIVVVGVGVSVVVMVTV